MRRCGDAALERVPRERCLLKARVDLELIHCGHDRSLGEDAIEVWLEEVRDPDRPDDSLCIQLLWRLPGLDAAIVQHIRPMDEIEVDDLHSEGAAAGLERGERPLEPLVGVAEFGRDEDLIAGQAALPDGFADSGLVAISSRRVDVPVAGGECRLGRPADILRGDLVDTVAQLRDLDSVVQRD